MRRVTTYSKTTRKDYTTDDREKMVESAEKETIKLARVRVLIAAATSELSVILSCDGNVLITRLSRGHAWCILEKGFTQLCHPRQGGFDQALQDDSRAESQGTTWVE